MVKPVVKKIKFKRLYVKVRKGNESRLYVYKDAVPGKPIIAGCFTNYTQAERAF
jgi:hypothetical protein